LKPFGAKGRAKLSQNREDPFPWPSELLGTKIV
jgi:hypothetical protein